MTDRDYRNEDASAESWIRDAAGRHGSVVCRERPSFGANQFYGPYPSWERTKGWFGAMRQELGSQTEAAFGVQAPHG